MKKLLTLLSIAFAAFSCGDKPSDGPNPPSTTKVSLSDTAVYFTAEANQKTITLVSEGDWELRTDGDWFTATPNKGAKGSYEVKLNATQSDLYDDRAAILTSIADGYKVAAMTVMQVGKNAIVLTQKVIELPSIANEINVELRSSVECEVTIPADAAWVTIPATKTMQTKYLKFQVTTNNTGAKRTAEILVQQKGGELKDVLIISQNPTSQTINPTLAKMTTLELQTATKIKPLGAVSREDFTIMKYMSSLKDIDLSEAELPNGEIPSEAFWKRPDDGTLRMQSIVFPANIRAIGAKAFCGDTTHFLAKVPNLQNIESIGESAFYNCFSYNASLPGQTLTLPKTLKFIGEKAFSGRSSGNSLSGQLVIPESVEMIGEKAFSGCIFSSYKVSWAAPIKYTSRMLNYSGTGTVYVPAASVGAYKAADGWKNHTIIGY